MPNRENTGFNSGVITNGASLTVAITATANTKRFYLGLAVGLTTADPIGAFEISGTITWNSGAQSFTGIPSSKEGDGNFCGTKWYYLDNPASGSSGIVITNNAGGTVQMAAGAIGYTDAGLTHTAYINTASTANPSVTCTGSANGDDVLGILFSDTGPVATTTETDTLIGEVENLSADTDCNVQVGSATGASFVSDWTCSDTTNGWSVSALTVNIAPVTRIITPIAAVSMR
jgi:hypothetical protein